MRKFAPRIISVLAVLGMLAVNAQIASAGTLTTPRDYLNRQKASQTSGVQHQVFFTTANAVSGGAGNNVVTLTFPDGDNWCATAGTDLATSGITDPTGGSESATSLPGTLSGECTQGANDAIIITGVDDLSAATEYGVQIGDGTTGKLGTSAAANDIKVTITTNDGSSDVDSATYALSIISDDQVVVSATIDPTLTVVLSANTANLGTLSTSQVNQASITSTVDTNASGGYVSLVKYDATLTSGSNTIPDESGGGTIVAGTSEYGASTDSGGTVDLTSTSNSCATGAGPMNADPLSTTFQVFGEGTAAVSSDVTTLCFVATTSATQAPGTYTSTSTLVTTARF